MNKTTKHAGAALVVLLLLTFSSGCSLIGYGIGTAIDNGRPNVVPVHDSRADNLGTGEKVYCIANDGEVIRGKVKGYSQLTPEEYAHRYEISRRENTASMNLPALHTPIKVTALSESEFEYRFEGFDIHCSESGKLPTMYLIWGEASEPIEVRLANIRKLTDSRGNELNPEQISKYILDGRIPVMKRMEIEVSTELKEIDSDELEGLTAVSINSRYNRFSAVRTSMGEMTYFSDRGAACVGFRKKPIVIKGELWNGRNAKIPLASAVALYNDVPTHPEIKEIALNDLEYFGRQNSKNAKWTFLGIGAAIDALAVVFAIGMSSMNWGSGSGGWGY